jgi:hypothetical protein
MEGRDGLAGIPHERAKVRTQSRVALPPKLVRVNEAARRSRQTRLTALLHHVEVASPWRAFSRLKRGASAGVDGERLQGVLLRVRAWSERASSAGGSAHSSDDAVCELAAAGRDLQLPAVHPLLWFDPRWRFRGQAQDAEQADEAEAQATAHHSGGACTRRWPCSISGCAVCCAGTMRTMGCRATIAR